jgi:putative transposase
MLGKGNFSDDFKRDAVAQITERGYPVSEVSKRLGVSPHSLYVWKKKFSAPPGGDDKDAEIRRLKRELTRVTEERDILNRVARLAGLAGIKAQIGYKRRPGSHGGKPSVIVDNTLDRQFDVEDPDKVWVTDINYIRTLEGFSYLAVVIDLYSRRVVGWSMQSRQTTDVVLQALLMAVWRRKPKHRVLIHSDQGSQFTSRDWASFLKAHNLEHSMRRRGNCHDNAVAESFFNLFKRERIRRGTYKTRADARQDVFDYIEMFYNPQRKHTKNGMLSPVEFERQQKTITEGV